MAVSTITAGAATISPLLITGYASERQAGNVIHDVIGRPDQDVTLRPARLRSGTLKLLMPDEASAAAASDALAAAVVCTLSHGDLTTASFPFVCSGRIMPELDPQTLTRWLVSVEYQEVSA